jgi:hypothetical protein
MRSGAPRCCEGPRVYRFYGGAATWNGCPRLSLGARENAWISWYDRTQGRLSATELLTLPLLLVDAFDVLDELKAQAEAYERAKAGK